jgi:hypothetical protein
MTTAIATELELLVTTPVSMDDDMATGDDAATDGDDVEPADADLVEPGEEEEKDEAAE